MTVTGHKSNRMAENLGKLHAPTGSNVGSKPL